MPVDALIFDDDLGFGLLLLELLGARGFGVKYHCSGLGALDHIRRERPRLVIVDPTMEGLSGVPLCSELRRDALTANTRVIATSGSRPPDSVSASQWAEADYYVEKPAETAGLLAALLGLLDVGPPRSPA